MNVRGLHLRPGAHSSYPRAAPGAPLPRYRYPAAAAAAAVNYGPSGSKRQQRPFIFFVYEKKIKTAGEHLFFFLGNKSIKPKTQFQKHKELEVVLHWITRVSQLVLCDLIPVCLSYSFMAIQVHRSKANRWNRHGVPGRYSLFSCSIHMGAQKEHYISI
jgi:hypothetical protein